MADFKDAELRGEHAEGGYADLDGGTYKGIARHFFPDWEGWAIVDSHMPLKHGEIITDQGLATLVYTFYKVTFWDKMCGDHIDNQAFANYFYDWFINSGATAVKKLQEIIGINPPTGFFGNITLTKVNQAGERLLPLIHARRLQFYHDHCNAVPADAKFLQGWLNRANNLYDDLK